MIETLEQTTARVYRELISDYLSVEIEIWIGGYNGLREIIKDGNLQALYMWLNEPEPDWQRDC